MPNLANCIKTTGVKLSSDTKKEIMSAYNEAKKTGIGHKKAAVTAVNSTIKSLLVEQKKIQDVISKGAKDKHQEAI